MIRKKIQVGVPGGIHLAVASSLAQTVLAEGAHVFLKSGKKMVSVREMQKVLALGVHQWDQIEVLVDSEQEEESVLERIEKILCSGL